jgi:D-beta-D-heptose 7-phosphate kinase/D-beta-D-heptose 1-phosphate adenosyltransferase
MSMSFVDDCIIFDDTSPTSIIETINPEIVVKGGEWTADEVRVRDKISNHIEIKIFPFYKNYSTTNIIERINSDESK